MAIHHIAKCVTKIGSSSSEQSWDNTGVLIDSHTPKNSDKKILICIDFTLAVLQECIENNIKFVISYHPCIFHPIKKLDNELYIKCIQNYISLFCPHTQLDDFMNLHIKELIGENPGNLDQIIVKIKEISGLKTVRIVRSERNGVYHNNGDIRIGVGAAFRNVTVENCLLITGEMSHHDLLKCKSTKTDVIMLEHSNSERIVLPEIKRLLETDSEMEGYEIYLSQKDLDPVDMA